MFKRFTTKELILIALMSALVFILAIAFGTILTAVTGIPLMGGLIINLFLAYILLLTLMIIRKFWTATLLMLIYTALSTPTINFGPPGVYKIFLGIGLGFIADILLHLGKYKKWIYYFTAGFSFTVFVPIMWYVLTLLGLPGANKLKAFVLPLMAIYLIESLFATWLATITYNKKLKDKQFVKHLKDV